MTGDGRAGATTRAGFAFASIAFLTWGFVPLFFKLLETVPPIEVLAHRILWTVPLIALMVWVFGLGPRLIAVLRDVKRLWVYALSTALISTNWLTFIWAVSNERVLEISLGYYINPLFTVALGVFFLSERLTTFQGLAILLAVLGVGAQLAVVGSLPWVSLYLATSFGLYTLVRKRAGIDPLVGLLVETALVLPLALLAILAWETSGVGVLASIAEGTSSAPYGLWSMLALLVAAGAFTAIPLVFFMAGAQRLRLSTIGIFQYTAPSIQLVLATLLLAEPFGWIDAVTFASIWLAIALFSFDAWRADRARRQALPA